MGVCGWQHCPVSRPETLGSLTAGGCITLGDVKEIGGGRVCIKLMAGCSLDLAQSIANAMSRKVNSAISPWGLVLILLAEKICVMYSNENHSLVS